MSPLGAPFNWTGSPGFGVKMKTVCCCVWNMCDMQPKLTLAALPGKSVHRKTKVHAPLEGVPPAAEHVALTRYVAFSSAVRIGTKNDSVPPILCCSATTVQCG